MEKGRPVEEEASILAQMEEELPMEQEMGDVAQKKEDAAAASSNSSTLVGFVNYNSLAGEGCSWGACQHRGDPADAEQAREAALLVGGAWCADSSSSCVRASASSLRCVRDERFVRPCCLRRSFCTVSASS